MAATRRLAAILAADVAGYSRLIGADEEGTLERLKALRRELVDPKIAEHHGRIVKTTGDGMLVEFASVVDAVRCAVAVQQAMPERNTGIGAQSRIELRIGINLGDVIVVGDDLYGDGVNIAARIEVLADAGGVFVSNTVYDHVRDRLPLDFEDLGEQQVKNIARPVRVYRVRPESPHPSPPPLAGEGSAPRARVGGPEPPALALPDKPSIAVLSFQNISGDPEQEYFVDGIVEEIITALSRIRWLFVIARNSSSTYKGQAIHVRQVGRELGVRYVLEGSVRKSGNQVRITTQLIDIGAMMALIDRALGLNPSFARGWDISAALRLKAGESDLAIGHAETSLRLSPRAPFGAPLWVIGTALFCMRRFDEAISKLLLAIQDLPSFAIIYRILAACYAHMGRLDEAREVITRLRAITPLVMPDPRIRYLQGPDNELLLSGLRLAIGETG
jgi:class 3 adenylate cyclase/TolB-like protein